MSRVANSTPRTKSPTWRELVEQASGKLASSTEARWIADDVRKVSGLAYHDVEDIAPNAPTRDQFTRLVERRIAGEPLQHVLGHWPFRALDLLVDRRALVPRPETEMVVEYALLELGGVTASPLVVDLGTGSGAIACAIASEHPRATVVAVELSPEAAELARSNRSRLAADIARRIEVRVGDWFDPLPADVRGRVDLVVSNPPYVAEHEWSALDPVVRDFDPKVALVAGPLGTEAVGEVIKGAPAVLAAGGVVVVEIAPWQAEAACTFAHTAGARSADVRRDLAGRERVVVARW